MFIQDIESCRAIHSTESSSTLLPTATRDVLKNLTIPQQTMSRSHLKTCPHESGVSRGAAGGGGGVGVGSTSPSRGKQIPVSRDAG